MRIRQQSKIARNNILDAARSAGSEDPATLVPGISLTLLTRKSIASAGLAGSRWSPLGARASDSREMKKFRKTTMLHKKNKQAIQARRAAGEKPYQLLPPRKGALFQDAGLLPSLASLASTPGTAVRVFPAYQMYSTNRPSINMGSNFTMLSVEPHGESIKNANLVLVNSLYDLDSTQDAKCLRCAVHCIGMGIAVMDVSDAAKPDGPGRNSSVVHLAPAARKIAAHFHCSQEFVRRFHRVVGALDDCAGLKGSKWKVFRHAGPLEQQASTPQPKTKSKLMTVNVDIMPDLLQFLRHARRLKRKRGLSGKLLSGQTRPSS